MSRPRTSWKTRALEIDPKATIRKENPGGDAFDLTQWRVYDGAGKLIGHSERGEISSGNAWMRAYYSLGGGRRARA